MSDNSKTTWMFGILTCVFICLTIYFVRSPILYPHVYQKPVVPSARLAGIPSGTIRISAAQLIKSGADVSGLDCYACHDPKHPPVIKFALDGQVILPKEHTDLIYSMRNCEECHSQEKPQKIQYNPDGSTIIPKAHQDLMQMAHGKAVKNNNCYNCHNENQLNTLHSSTGKKLNFDQATQLCAGCHGTIYEDWLAGSHGRTEGYWDHKLGPARKQECSSCHDPHAPSFTGIIPMPGPHLLHPEDAPDTHNSTP
ncbi:MAG: hypothetical protein WCO38_03080 [Verrucomicrobiota bacterium]